MMAALRLVFATLVALLLIAERLHAQPSITAARELYASAEYDAALQVLDRLSAAAAGNDERQSIDLYRTLCLLAIGRRDDANRAIESIIARDPLFRPGNDLSPRTRGVFSEAKRRVLPSVLQQYYSEAKAAFERKEYEAAAAAFKQVLDA